MNTEKLILKTGDAIIGNDGMGDKFGYYKETEIDKKGIWVKFTSSKTKKTNAVYVRSINNVRLATTEEINTYENK